MVEIAHESLLRQWPQLQEWLAADREDLKIVEGVEQAASQWMEHAEAKIGSFIVAAACGRPSASRFGLTFAIVSARADTLILRPAASIRGDANSASERWLSYSWPLSPWAGPPGGFSESSSNMRFRFKPTCAARYVLTDRDRALALSGNEYFQDCADCPYDGRGSKRGNFQMGSPPGQGDRTGREYSQHSCHHCRTLCGFEIRTDLL